MSQLTFVRNDWTCSEDGQPTGRPTANTIDDSSAMQITLIDARHAKVVVHGVTFEVFGDPPKVSAFIQRLDNTKLVKLPAGTVTRDGRSVIVGGLRIEVSTEEIAARMEKEKSSFRWPPEPPHTVDNADGETPLVIPPSVAENTMVDDGVSPRLKASLSDQKVSDGGEHWPLL